VIEYLLEDGLAQDKKLVNLTAVGFAAETASESPAPGGGSVSAYMGALGAALGTMVANLSSHKPGWDDRWEYFSDWAVKGQQMMNEMLFLVDEDTNAFNKILDAFSLPKGSEEEKAARSAAIQTATFYATEVPLKTMKVASSALELAETMVKEGNPNSVSDAGVGALAIRSAVYGAYMNVRINSAGLKDRSRADALLSQSEEILSYTVAKETEIIDLVLKTIGR
jgi:glutamate formiminotransferase/formiminotetrahydrofolate cyclodeaminase